MRQHVRDLGDEVIRLQRRDKVWSDSELYALQLNRRLVPFDQTFPHDLDRPHAKTFDLVNVSQTSSKDTRSKFTLLTGEHDSFI